MKRDSDISDLNRKTFLIFLIIGICILGSFLVIGTYLNRDEGGPYFGFIEVPFNATTNGTVIHLEDKDIMNVRGMDVKFENGKLAYVTFRDSGNFSYHDFDDMYGSKYLEYRGVYYYVMLAIP